MSGAPTFSPAPQLAADATLDLRVLSAQTEMLYRRSQPAALIGIVFALLLFVGLQPTTQNAVAWLWLVLRCALSLLRLLLGRAYLRLDAPEPARWHRGLVRLLALDGLVWGLAVVCLAPGDSAQLMDLLLASLLGVASVGMFVLQPSARACTTFITALLLPVALGLALSAAPYALITASCVLGFLVLLLVEARRAQARIRELLTLRFSAEHIAEQRADALRLAQRQSNVKSQFLATMSHEMRTPLHGILGLTRMLQKDRPADPTQQLDLIEHAGEHLLTLINDILDFSKLEAGQVRLASRVFDLAALIDDVVAMLVPSAAEVGLTLTARLRLPRPCHVYGDPARLRQVLQNLIGNAIKFTETGSVTVLAKHSGSRARVAVHDTGVGITADELPRIFDAFHQADSSFTRRFSGTGLGLTIARELARAMGGDLVCTSKPGRGTCFTLSAELPAAAAPAPAAAPRPAVDAAPLLRGRVLLAEDNPVNAMVAEAALRKMGLSVEHVEDGLQAVAAFRAQVPDLVLLDCQMPVMDGFEAARRMREHEGEMGLRRTPVVALTANALQGDREQSLAAGMDEHLAKPFRDDELRQLLTRIMQPAFGLPDPSPTPTV